MNDELKKLHGEILKIQTNVCFWENGRFYDIKEYDGDDGGYMIEVFEQESQNGCFEAQGTPETELLTWVDGGQIYSEEGFDKTNPVDAISFMFKEEV